MDTIEAAIERSITHNEIVTIEGDTSTLEELASLCDDSVRTSYDRGPDEAPGVLVEYWGTDDGDDWRVHVELKWQDDAL